MKFVIFLGMLVIFISCFFIFFTFDAMAKSKMICTSEGEAVRCNFMELNATIIFGILVVGMFLFVDSLVLYVMIKSWVPDLFMYGANK